MAAPQLLPAVLVHQVLVVAGDMVAVARVQARRLAPILLIVLRDQAVEVLPAVRGALALPLVVGAPAVLAPAPLLQMDPRANGAGAITDYGAVSTMATRVVMVAHLKSAPVLQSMEMD